MTSAIQRRLGLRKKRKNPVYNKTLKIKARDGNPFTSCKREIKA
jgi:hypothetical protein